MSEKKASSFLHKTTNAGKNYLISELINLFISFFLKNRKRFLEKRKQSKKKLQGRSRRHYPANHCKISKKTFFQQQH